MEQGKQGQVSGIGPSNDDLLVFGYSAKLFRNNEVALKMDRGDLLIPWMGDPSMKIDRFDGRTEFDLIDMRSHEASASRKDFELSEDDQEEENLCEEERYRSLKGNPRLFGDPAPSVKEKTLYGQPESAAKAAAAGGGAAIAFNYDNPPQQAQAPSDGPNDSQPSLKTLANVLEKTANFIAGQGAQMEILMRAKEAANPKFQFLNPDNPYHPIYKQVLEKKRAKLKNPYLGSSELQMLSIEEVEASLRQLTANLPSAAPSLGGATVQSAAQSADPAQSKGKTAYSKLVERIKEHHKASNPATPSPSPPPPPPGETTETASAKTETNQQQASEDQSDEVMVEPPQDLELQMLIDRTASYVCRQNLEFGHQKGAEKIGVVKKLHKEKFAFLFPENKYNSYYLFKVALYTEMLERKRVEELHEQSRRDLKRRAEESHSEMQELTLKSHPTLKGFFNS